MWHRGLRVVFVDMMTPARIHIQSRSSRTRRFRCPRRSNYRARSGRGDLHLHMSRVYFQGKSRFVLQSLLASTKGVGFQLLAGPTAGSAGGRERGDTRFAADRGPIDLAAPFVVRSDALGSVGCRQA